jgi:transposase
MPTGWEVIDDRLLCLSCARREAGLGLSKAESARRRSAEVLREQREDREVEIRAALAVRAPAHGGAPIAEVAAETSATESRVRHVRKRMREEGELAAAERGSARPPKKRSPDEPTAQERAEVALRRDHRRETAEVAEEVGVSIGSVKRARLATGLTWSARARSREDALESLRRLGEVPFVDVAADLGIEPETARQRLDALVEAGLATKRPGRDQPGRNKRRVYRAAA